MDDFIGADLQKAKGLSAFAADARVASFGLIAGKRCGAVVGAAKRWVGGGVDSDSGGMKGRCEMKGA